MNTTKSLDSSTLRKTSLLFWCTFVIPVAIIGIGINFILNPVGASTAYGIPMHDPATFPFMWIKGIRDIFSGLVVLTFLWVCAAHLYSLGNSALHDDRCRVSSEKEGRLT